MRPLISGRQIFLYVPASQFALPPRSSLPLRIPPQGSRGFYIRAERASLPPHAPDMLTVRTQAIDGTRTFTSLDPQPCRLLTRCQRPSPRHYGSASRFVPRTRLSAGWFSRLQTFRYVQASAFASSPRSLLPLPVSPQGSRDFYVRAYRALLPPHAPDMLSAGIQVIDGKRTFTFPDLQPCRLLQCPHRHDRNPAA